MTVEFKIWKIEGDVDQGFVDGAIDAINTLDSQINIDLAAEGMSPDIPELKNAESYGDLLKEDVVPHVVDN